MPCIHCHGTAGHLIDGAHALCAARVNRGLATPCLGNRCEACGGKGWVNPRITSSTVFPVYFHPGEAKRGLDAMFPPCAICQGKGYTTP